MGVAPNALRYPDVDFLAWEVEVDQAVYEVPELGFDAQARARAEQFIGSVVTGVSFEVENNPRDTTSLMEAIRRAREGDPVARKLLEANVRTDVIERTIKAGHIMSVDLEVDADGHILQYGQSGRAIQANSLKFASHNPKMRERTEPETRNLFRTEEALALGLLEDYVVVVPSRPADNMSLTEMHDEGFFTDTMSIALQATTLDAHGKLVVESAFVAGKPDRDSLRRDDEMIIRLGDVLGVDYRGKTVSEIIDSPLLVPKSLIPNGVIDLVKLLDEPYGTFFGQDKPRQDYLRYKEQCRRRESELEPTVQEVVGALMAQADTMHAPIDATRLLHELSEEKMLKRALTDDKIDSIVFGVGAAYLLEAARYYHELGDANKADEFLGKALKIADSNSCPGGGIKSGDSSGNQKGSGADGDADCEYTSKACPICGAKNVRTSDKRISGNKRRISGSCGCSKDYVKKVTKSDFSLAA